MAMLAEPDAYRWRLLGGRVAIQLEPCLDPWVVANRAIGGPDRWSLQPLRPALRRARRLAARIAARSAVVLRTDVAAFYPSVLPETLHGALRWCGVEPDRAAEAAELLEGWGSHGHPGLPIGPPASAVMANVVLAPVDRTLAGLPFVRWVDDYLIGLPNAAVAAAVLERIDEALGGLGLRRSVDKTAVVAGHRPLRWLGMSASA